MKLLFVLALGYLAAVMAQEEAPGEVPSEEENQETMGIETPVIGVDLGEDIGIGIADEYRCSQGQPKGEDGVQYCKVLTDVDVAKRKALTNGFVVLTPKTKASDAWKRFARSAATFKYTVKELGTEKEANTEEAVFKLLKTEINARKADTPDGLVLFIDNVDSILSAGAARIVEEFELSEAGILVAGDTLLRDPKGLQAKFPKLEHGRAFMDTGSFVATVKTLADLFAEFPTQKTFGKVLETAYMKLDTRKRFRMKIDSTCSVFQNLDQSEDEIDIRFAGKDAYLQNLVYTTVPIVIRANEKSQVLMNNIASYLAKSWNLNEGCVACWEDMISLEEKADDALPLVTMGLFIEKPTPFLEEFFTTIEALNYPKQRINLYVHNSVEYHAKVVYEWLDTVKGVYASLKNISYTQTEIKEPHAKNEAMDYCIEQNCDFLFMVDASGRLNNPYTLRLLIEQNRDVISPLLPKPGKAWSNYWGALTPQGFYARSEDYMDITQNKKRGLWNVPYVSEAILIKRQILGTAETKPTFINKLADPDMAFCQSLREKYDPVTPNLSCNNSLDSQGIFMYVTNRVDFGHLIGRETYDITRYNPELWELFDNRFDWERRYLHVNYSQSLNESNTVETPCPDVFWFPLFKERFTQELIDLMESQGKWSDGSHSDSRIEGGYESVPTVDIHMKQVHFEEEWLEILRAYIQPLQLRVFKDYYNEVGPPRALMNFVVRYKPEEQPLLRPHHDTSTYTINVALNRPGIDYQGGGCRFIRYDCSVVNTRVGWVLMHPGRLTHLHEGLRVTQGTRYIVVSFVDP